VGVGDGNPLVLIDDKPPIVLLCCFLANANSLIFDYLVRQKMGGSNLTYTVLNQIPVLPPEAYGTEDTSYISRRVLELVYTSVDIQPFATECGFEGVPFKWDCERRDKLRNDLDAYYAHLYALTRDELRYILEPKEVFGEDFPSETFRVLKEKEEKEYGEYRTRRLVLASYDELAKTDRFAGEKRESVIEAPKGRSMVPVRGSGE
jgi:hypothetical protein